MTHMQEIYKTRGNIMKHLIFDFDGTLVDSMPAWSDSVLGILDARGIPYEPTLIKTLTTLGYRGTVAYFQEHLGLTDSTETLVEEMGRRAIPAYQNTILAKEAVCETLHALKAAGYHLHVLTASPHITLDACLKRIQLWELFDHVWSCEDFNTTKSDVRIYHMAAERIGVTVEDCIFFDDNANACRTAKSAGMTVVGVHDDSSAQYRVEMLALCDGFVDRFDELPALLKTL